MTRSSRVLRDTLARGSMLIGVGCENDSEKEVARRALRVSRA